MSDVRVRLYDEAEEPLAYSTLYESQLLSPKCLYKRNTKNDKRMLQQQLWEELRDTQMYESRLLSSYSIEIGLHA